VLAPMPSASTSKATALKPGTLRRARKESGAGIARSVSVRF
jgi:hypothetical protein